MKKLLLLLLVLAGLWWIFLRDPSATAPVAGIRQSETPEQTATFVSPWTFVELKGFLVEVQKDGADQTWRSSLVRDDEGAGACEIFWITDIAESTP